MPIPVVLTLAVLFLLGCQSAPPAPPSMSVEEAKKATADFGETRFIAPPRTITDITAIPDQQKSDELDATGALVRVRAEPPSNASPLALARFYRRRADAAIQLGLANQGVSDARESVRNARLSNAELVESLMTSSAAEIATGARGISSTNQELLEVSRRSSGTYVISALMRTAAYDGGEGDLESARKLVAESDNRLNFLEVDRRDGVYLIAALSNNARSHGRLEEQMGRHRDAERWYLQAIVVNRSFVASITSGPMSSTIERPGFYRGYEQRMIGELARTLVAQERFAEAEANARAALLDALREGGRVSPNTANATAVTVLACKLDFTVPLRTSVP